MSSVTVLEIKFVQELVLDKGHYLFRRYKAMLAITTLDLEGGPETVEETSSRLQVTESPP